VADTLIITRREGLGLATIMARKGASAASIGAAIGTTPPDGPACASGDGLSLIVTGPGTWLGLTEQPGPDWAPRLADNLTGLASVSDQSGAYAVLRLAGMGARTLLQRGAAIDLHPDVFRPGSAATTVIAHIGVILWQIDMAPSFEVALFRSYAASFRHWMDATTATLRTNPSSLATASPS
jgi:sarcosine oxidase subunit gamma